MSSPISFPSPSLSNHIPYYSVTFSSMRSLGDNDYSKWSDLMVRLASEQEGYLGAESLRDPLTGYGITISYWKSLENIHKWKQQTDHQQAQLYGQQKWYNHYSVKIAQVQREYQFNHNDKSSSDKQSKL